MLFDTKGHCFERQIIMLHVRWDLSYKLSYRDLEEMAEERGLEVDHTTCPRQSATGKPHNSAVDRHPASQPLLCLGLMKATIVASLRLNQEKPGKDRLLHNHRLVDNNLLNSDTKMTQEELIHTELPVTVFDEEGNGICGCGDGTFMPMSGAFEESSEIDVMDRIYILRRHKRQQCKCTSCGKIIAAKGPLKLKPGAEFSVQMAVQVVDDKIHRHIPLNRQAEMMSERGLQVGTKTLYSLSEHLMELLKKIPSLIRTEIHSRDHIHIAESPMDLFNPKTKGYVWSITNQIGAYYQFETTRSGKVAREMISGYRGIVMADGYAGYEFL